MRSHANYHMGDDPLRGIRALLELRSEFAGLVDLQIVASPGPSDGPDDLGRDAVATLTDHVGEILRATAPADEAVRQLVRLLQDYQGREVKDDATVLCVDWAGPGAD